MIPVTEPAPVRLRMTLELMFPDTLVLIAVKAPVPVSVPEMMVLVVMAGVPLPAVLTMPDQTPAPDVKDEQF